jgi:hypothetical protein
MIPVRHEYTGHIENAVDVAAVTGPAAFITLGVVTMAFEDFLDQRVGVQEVEVPS